MTPAKYFCAECREGISEPEDYCPGCGSYSSSIRIGFQHGGQCPQCGLSETSATEIKKLREKQWHNELTGRLATAIIERDKAVEELYDMKIKFNRVQTVVKSMLEGNEQ